MSSPFTIEPLGKIPHLTEQDRQELLEASQFGDTKRLAQMVEEISEFLKVGVVVNQTNRWYILFDQEGFLCLTSKPEKALRLCLFESQGGPGFVRRWLARPKWVQEAPKPSTSSTLSLSDLGL